jgi:hypothetical protein
MIAAAPPRGRDRGLGYDRRATNHAGEALLYGNTPILLIVIKHTLLECLRSLGMGGPHTASNTLGTPISSDVPPIGSICFFDLILKTFIKCNLGPPLVAGESVEGVSLRNEEWPRAIRRPRRVVRSGLSIPFTSLRHFHMRFLGGQKNRMGGTLPKLAPTVPWLAASLIAASHMMILAWREHVASSRCW